MEKNIKGRCLIFMLAGLIFILFLNTNMVLAASCPCCGQTYGAPMPGDEARVHQLRWDHEASCCTKVITPKSQQAPVIDNEADVKRQDNPKTPPIKKIGWKKALSCAMKEVYARAESLGPAGVRFSKDLRKEMKRVFNEAGKPVKDSKDVNVVNLTLDRQVAAGKGSAGRQFNVNVAVYSKNDGKIDVDVQSYFSKSGDIKDRQENIQSVMMLNKNGEIIMSENSAAVNACLAR